MGAHANSLLLKGEPPAVRKRQQMGMTIIGDALNLAPKRRKRVNWERILPLNTHVQVKIQGFLLPDGFFRVVGEFFGICPNRRG